MKMVTLKLHTQLGAPAGDFDVDESCFAAGINGVLLRQAVKMYTDNRRVGTVKSKSRAEVSGSSRKLYKQKGTGNARAGNKRTPVRRGGGHCFAKSPRSWRTTMPRKAMRSAAGMAVLSKLMSGRVVVVDALSIDVPRTREVAAMLAAVGVAGSSCLLAIHSYDQVIWKACRNIPGVVVAVASDLNADCVMRAKYLVATKAAMGVLAERFSV
ncbi:MAG: 50S ribosomal protein L4 [Planctomycetales bacterium]|nr:50S ribosomal protein L4 [Planctomycetales bacterium]